MALADLARQALVLALALSTPPLLAALVAGAVVGVVAVAVRAHELASSPLPRQLAVGAVALAAGSAGAGALVRFAQAAWAALLTRT